MSASTSSNPHPAFPSASSLPSHHTTQGSSATSQPSPIPKNAYPRSIGGILRFIDQTYSPQSSYILPPTSGVNPETARGDDRAELHFHPKLTQIVVKPVLDSTLSIETPRVQPQQSSGENQSRESKAVGRVGEEDASEVDVVARGQESEDLTAKSYEPSNSKPRSTTPGPSSSNSSTEAPATPGTPPGPSAQSHQSNTIPLVPSYWDPTVDRIPGPLSSTATFSTTSRLNRFAQTASSSTTSAAPVDIELAWLAEMMSPLGDSNVIEDGARPRWRKEKGLAVLYLLCRRFSIQDPTEQSQPYFLLDLAAKVAAETPREDLILASEQVTIFAKGLLNMALSYGVPEVAVEILETLIHRYEVQGALTPVHAVFLEACLWARSFDLGYAILRVPVTNLNLVTLSYLDVLSYFYLGGMICIELQRWKEARDNFEIAVATPGNATSLIQLVAHRRLVLINLIISGKSPNYPKYISASTQRTIRSQAKEYAELASAFEAMNEEKVLKAVNESEQFFRQHENWELIQRVLSTYGERKVLQLPNIYQRMSIIDVAQHASSQVAGPVQPDVCERMILDLVERGKLHARVEYASIDEGSTSVRFIENPQPFNTTESADHLTNLIGKVNSLERFFASHDKNLGMTEKWLKSAIGKGDGGKNELPGMMASGGVPIRGAGSNWADTGF